MKNIPVLFISHGPPLVGVKPCPARDFIKSIGVLLPRPEAILCVSAHWESSYPLVTLDDRPEILYDFGGVGVLRQMTYHPTGAPWLAEEIISVLCDHGLNARGMARGLDHGAWIPLMLMYPNGDVPVVQLSIQTDADATHHYRLGKALAPLRASGVLILASGGAVHNIREASEYAIDDEPPKYVRQFDRWLEKQIVSDQTDRLLDYQRKAPDPYRCHPYPHEHLLPLYVALGVAKGLSARRMHDSFLFGTLSMAAYAWT